MCVWMCICYFFSFACYSFSSLKKKIFFSFFKGNYFSIEKKKSNEFVFGLLLSLFILSLYSSFLNCELMFFKLLKD